ncbi:hypothetical protein [Agrobacterium cavarae]|uniref:hypothetical protein n=1 Tax=Agrobacterium cavarae TaxID=2528239 RepID=UPI0028AC6F20|nr:hypothetical protein [Agrobacterium cavarae]
MTSTRELRIKAFNNWPAETVFPVQQQYTELLARANVQAPIVHCNLGIIDDREFHILVAYLLDGLDALPHRPDWAFESFYVPLEMEMNRIKESSGNFNASRFLEYKEFLKTLEQSTIAALAEFVSLAPLQLCEFAAGRILSAKARGSSSDQQLLKRAQDALGSNLFDAFCTKYMSGSISGDGKVKAGNQRKAGGLIKLLIEGVDVDLNGVTATFDGIDRVGILSTVILPSIRNDRFHGNVFPSFRSSAYKLKHYAGSQFASTTAFMLVLVSIAVRWPTCLSSEKLNDAIEQNARLFEKLFKNQIGK